jgi:hypothetical protein
MFRRERVRCRRINFGAFFGRKSRQAFLSLLRFQKAVFSQSDSEIHETQPYLYFGVESPDYSRAGCVVVRRFVNLQEKDRIIQELQAQKQMEG